MASCAAVGRGFETGGILAAVRLERKLGFAEEIQRRCRGALCGRSYWRHRRLHWPWLVFGEGYGSVSRPLSMNFLKLRKPVSRRHGPNSAFGEGRGEFEGGREPPLCASQRGSLPPSTKSLLQSLTRYRGARSGRLATRSASAGRKGRSRAWAGVTQRSS